VIPVAFDLRDPVRSGIARVATSLAQAVAQGARGRYQLVLAGPARQLEDLGASRWSSGVRLVDWDAPRYSPRAELTWSRVRREVGPAVWYFPHWDIPWHALPPRFIVTIHDLGHLVLSDVSRARRAIARRWIARATHRATLIAAVTEFGRRQLTDRWPELGARTRVVPNGVDPRFFDAPPDLPGTIAARIGDSPYMLSVGNLKTHKNLAMGPEVLRRIPGLRWVVVGERFPDWVGVENRATELGVEDRMIVLDRQPDGVLHALYAGAACLFFPSRHEGFGLPIVEALACGTPVVAGNAEGSVETLGGAGWVCDVDDPDAFASAVSAALQDRGADAERRIARAREFDWSRSAALLMDMFEYASAAR
jgi:glycosyltransferase involved in cell wall biosynthesis